MSRSPAKEAVPMQEERFAAGQLLASGDGSGNPALHRAGDSRIKSVEPGGWGKLAEGERRSAMAGADSLTYDGSLRVGRSLPAIRPCLDFAARWHEHHNRLILPPSLRTSGCLRPGVFG
jgi:hypothetical protein